MKDYYVYSGDSELLNELLPEMLELLKLFEALMSGAVPKKHKSDALAA